MSGWGVEAVEGGIVLWFVHALGDSGCAFLPPLWSPENTPAATQDYVRRHALCSRSFRGGHWPMPEDPDATAHEIASFFEPLIARHRPT